MPEKLLEDVVTAALFAIRSRQSDRHKAVSWFRIRPKGPTNLTIEQIADATGFSASEVRLLHREYKREVAEMAELLHDFVDRANRVLAFRRVLESFDDDIERHGNVRDELLVNVSLCQLLIFVSKDGARLLDPHTRADLLADIQSLMDVCLGGDELDQGAIRQLRSKLGHALEMATPKPLPVIGGVE